MIGKRRYGRGAVASLLVLSISLVMGCGGKQEGGKRDAAVVRTVDYTMVKIPEFSTDSAQRYLEGQLGFGYRVPGTKEHRGCAEYLRKSMERWCESVVEQPFNATLWNGETVKGYNIIASINPDASDRILLSAHWDSRMWADHDAEEANHRKPIMGANDGASGVAALMEMARIMSEQKPRIGVDFVLFDVEDQGLPEWADVEYQDNTWCKGSQYWAANPHRPYYRALYGILFDMVGTREPRFTKEEISRRYAQGVLNKVWNAASLLGYGQVFVNQDTDPILDDHLYVNQIANIPTIDIVQNTEGCSFFPYWHTIKDDVEAVDVKTMKMVADVVMKVIYGDYGEREE